MNRRKFNSKLLKGAGGAALLGSIPSLSNAKTQSSESLGVALVGLGGYSTYQLGPALKETKYCHLAGMVTGSPHKLRKWYDGYNLLKGSDYNYENFDAIADNEAIDIVYVVLPNSMHAEYCIRAAKAGKHVICEKPMGLNVAECDAIIDACEKAGVKLGMGYRLHSEPYTQEVKRLVREKTFGEVRFVSADAGYYSGSSPDQWRLDSKLSGGGALVNMGVYAIQSAIYGTGQNPISVAAQEFSTRPEYFKDTDETITAQFEFPNGAVGNITTSHNMNINRLYASCERGWYELEPANNYGPLKGRTSQGEISFPHKSQQALQMDDFAKHISKGTPNLAPGEMDKRDMIIVEAIYRSIKEGGKKIPLNLGSMGF